MTGCRRRVESIRASSSTTSMVASRRAFSTTRAQLSSPYHYPEGPRSNIPFNPLTKFFAFRYWTFMAVGFGGSHPGVARSNKADSPLGTPFGIAVWQTYKNQ
ncbi:hypothetical protein QTJ16_005523 [Diplocarpon rosae]|uniref:Uncharacterized protein n=1 Tax=Diplocarpon rosae TaxID=946125 RepID=A0AAD9SXX6_9HELO|nr:hypothetical protein QTJ16_005523 [Diplocarpon rosae]